MLNQVTDILGTREAERSVGELLQSCVFKFKHMNEDLTLQRGLEKVVKSFRKSKESLQQNAFYVAVWDKMLGGKTMIDFLDPAKSERESIFEFVKGTLPVSSFY